MSVVVIGVDPGDSTGVAALCDGKLIAAFQGTPEDAVTLIEILLTRFNQPDHDVTIACERFIQLGGRARTHQPTAQRLGGVIEAIARTYEVRFIWQGPADAWAIADNALLHRLKMFRTSHDVQQGDANDANMAVRHAILCLARLYASTFDALLMTTETTD